MISPISCFIYKLTTKIIFKSPHIDDAIRIEKVERFGEEVDLWIARSRLSLTVRFRLVNETLNYKWSLDTDRLWVRAA